MPCLNEEIGIIQSFILEQGISRTGIEESQLKVVRSQHLYPQSYPIEEEAFVTLTLSQVKLASGKKRANGSLELDSETQADCDTFHNLSRLSARLVTLNDDVDDDKTCLIILIEKDGH